MVARSTLLDELAGRFAPAVRARGHALAERGALAGLEATAGVVRARVVDGGEHLVEFECEDAPGAGAPRCACGEEACAHGWAVVLAAWREGWLGGGDRPAPAPATGGWRGRLEGLERARGVWEDLEDSDAGRAELRYVLDLEVVNASGELEVRIETRTPRGRWRAFEARGDTARWIVTAEDRALLALARRPPAAAALRVHAQDLRVVLELLAGTGRCHLAHRGGITPLAVDAGSPWRLGVAVVRVAGGGAVEARGILWRGAERLGFEELWLLHHTGAFVAGGRLGRAELESGAKLALGLFRDGPLRAPASEEDALVDHVLALRGVARLELPEGFACRSGAPVPCLLARVAGDRRRVRASLHFVYGDTRVAARSGVVGVRGEGGAVWLRDLASERRAARTLLELGASRGDEAETDVLVDPAGFAVLVRELLARGWRVWADGRRVRPLSDSRLRLQGGRDWLELRGDLEFEGVPAPVPALVAAGRRGQELIPLGDGSLGLLPEEWLRRCGLLAALGEASEDGVRFCGARAWLAAGLLEREAGIARTGRIAALEAPAALAEPRGFCGRLRAYQREALGWLAFLERAGLGGCLADDMGLGKTVQVLAWLAGRPRGPSLVVAPRSVVHHWKAEAARFAPGLEVLDYSGASRAAVRGRLAAADLVLTTYGVLRRDLEVLRGVTFEWVVLDEAQAIKNAASQAARSAGALRARHRLALSGTPIENRCEDLVSLLRFVAPRLVAGERGALAALRRLGARDRKARELLARAVRPLVLRRTKDAVAPDLPARTEQVVRCEMTAAQREFYRRLHGHYRARVQGALATAGGADHVVLEALLRLRQAACHPGLVVPGLRGASSAKVDLLLERLDELRAAGHKALVFSQFKTLLGLVRERLAEGGIGHEYLDGATRDRARRVARFREDPGRTAFLISLKAGGVGLNLVAARYVFLLDPWWNPAVEAQAIDRAHRIGQRAPVHAYRLVSAGTVEESVLELQDEKRELADALARGAAGRLAEVTREDLLRLLE